MASTFSDLKIELMATGEQSGTWGTTTNTNLGTAIEQAITGSGDVSFSSADVTLTLTDTNASQTARNLRLNLTGTSGGARNLIVPAIEKQYIINNGLADAVTVKNSTGTGVAVPAGKTMVVFNNATDVVDVTTHASSLTLGSALPVASGGTGQTTYTNGQLLIGNSTGNTLAKSTLTAGSGVSITNGAGSITISATGSGGDVVGPASATDNAVVRFDGTTGKLVQNSGVLIADDGTTVISVNSATDALRITQTGAGNALVVEDSANPDATPFVVDASGNVGIGATPTAGTTLDIQKAQTGAATAFTVSARINPDSTVTTAGYGFSSFAINGVGASTPNIYHYSAKQGTYSGTAPTNQYGFIADSSLTGATNNYGFFSDIASGTGRWNFYANGTADNYFAGNIYLGATTTNANFYNAKLISGAVNSYGFRLNATGDSTVTNNLYGYGSSLATSASAYTLTNLIGFVAFGATIGSGSTITNQYGFNAQSGLTGATNNYGFYSNIASGTGRWNFYANGTADNYFGGRIGIGTTNLTTNNINMNLAMTGGTTVVAVLNQGTVQSDATSNARYFQSFAKTAAASFTLTDLTHYYATQSTIGAGSTVTNQYGYHAESTLTGATNNYGFYSNIASGTGRWNFYANGTAANYFGGQVQLNQDYIEKRFTANSGTSITLDLANGTMQDITLTGSPTITMPTAVAGKSFILLLRSGAGSYAVTWSTVKWPGGTAPTVTTTASRLDIYSFFSDGTNWYGVTVNQNYTP